MLEFKELLRQTDGVRLVVSDGAILDGDFKVHIRSTKVTLG